MPKLLKNALACHRVYQKIQKLDIFYSIRQENKLKDCETNSSGEMLKALLPGFFADVPPPQRPTSGVIPSLRGLAV